MQNSVIRKRIRIFGVVQGVGFRPFVANSARSSHIRGTVCNKGSYVEVIAQGRPKDMEAFLGILKHNAPARSMILKMEIRDLSASGLLAASTRRLVPGTTPATPVPGTTPATPVPGTRKVTGSDPASGMVSVRDMNQKLEADESGFSIIESDRDKGAVFVSPDIAICPECRKELFDPNDRRYLHPFINCTACGPRLTIMDGMPYDRERTSMKKFPMCRPCHEEYTNPADRRYDAQPVCCNDCGPEVYLYDLTVSKPAADSGNSVNTPDPDFTRGQAIIRARAIIREGGIIAVKGIGGFHLCCDAADASAVARLRALKNRPYKPFAVMVKDRKTARRECIFGEAEEEMLTGPQKPILLLDRRRDGVMSAGKIVSEVAPGCPTIGIMLPYAPVQLLLFSYPDGLSMTDCLVMTSGNPSGAPICRTDEEALSYLAPMCDGILSNNRDILIRADDTVMMYMAEKPYMVRRSRGFAPLPVCFSSAESCPGSAGTVPAAAADTRKKPAEKHLPCILGIGGELKNTFCLAGPEYLYLSPYVGDLADRRSVKALSSALTRMEDLLEMKPAAVVTDLHPRYNATRFAQTLGLPVIYMQHHYAHIVSCMAENDFHDPSHGDNVIGVSFDGTGYGTDGTIWGGEFLRCSYRDFERIGSIESFTQAGGDRSSREGWRIALALMVDACMENASSGIAEFSAKSGPGRTVMLSSAEDWVGETAGRLGLCSGQELSAQLFLLKNRMNCVTSTSAGRLFDAVSAIIGLKRENTFEGEAATALEYAAGRYLKSTGIPGKPESAPQPGAVSRAWGYISNIIDQYGLVPEIRKTCPWADQDGSGGEKLSTLQKDAFTVGSAGSLVRFLCREKKSAEKLSADFDAALFHEYLAETILTGCLHMRELTGLETVALSGGVFQNRTLTTRARDLLSENGFRVLLHSLVPPNDGGLALGQAAYGLFNQLTMR